MESDLRLYKRVCSQQVSTTQFNTGLYPKMYFSIAAKFVTESKHSTIVIIRLLNSFLFAFLIFVILVLGQKSVLDPVLTCLAVAVPLVLFKIASINTSSWATTSGSILSLAAILAISNYRKIKSFAPNAILLIFAIFLGISSRFENKYILFLIVVTVIMAKSEIRKFFSVKYVRQISYIGILLSLFTLFIQRKQALQVLGIFNGINYERLLNAIHLLTNNVIELPHFFFGFFGGLGL